MDYNYNKSRKVHSKVFPEVFWIANEVLEISGERFDGTPTSRHPCLISHIKHKIPTKRNVFIFTSYKPGIHGNIIKKAKVFVYNEYLTDEHITSFIHLSDDITVSKLDIEDRDYIKTLEPKEAMRFKNAYIAYKERRNKNEP